MTDVSHELGALRHLVDSPLSSKVAMFNNQAQQHKEAQTLNPFSGSNDGRTSPKPNIPRDQYGKPLAGSLTEMRGQKANMHVLREMLELCQIIDSEGYNVKDEPTMRVIPFGELFNIYNYISDKVVGILLRARKHKFLEFEGEMLFQRRDDDVPIFLLRPIGNIRREIDAKIAEIKRGTSPAPQSTSVLMDKTAHKQKLEDVGLAVPGGRGKSKSRSPSPSAAGGSSKAASPTPASSKAASPEPADPTVGPVDAPSAAPVDVPASQPETAATPIPVVTHVAPEIVIVNENAEIQDPVASQEVASTPETQPEQRLAGQPEKAEIPEENIKAEPVEVALANSTVTVEVDATNTIVTADNSNKSISEISTQQDHNIGASEDAVQSDEQQSTGTSTSELPTVVIEASAVYDGLTTDVNCISLTPVADVAASSSD